MKVKRPMGEEIIWPTVVRHHAFKPFGEILNARSAPRALRARIVVEPHGYVQGRTAVVAKSTARLFHRNVAEVLEPAWYIIVPATKLIRRVKEFNYLDPDWAAIKRKHEVRAFPDPQSIRTMSQAQLGQSKFDLAFFHPLLFGEQFHHQKTWRAGLTFPPNLILPY